MCDTKNQPPKPMKQKGTNEIHSLKPPLLSSSPLFPFNQHIDPDQY